MPLQPLPMYLQFRQTLLSRAALITPSSKNYTKVSDRHKQYVHCSVSVLGALDNAFVAVSEWLLGVARKCEHKTAQSRCLEYADLEVCRLEAVL